MDIDSKIGQLNNGSFYHSLIQNFFKYDELMFWIDKNIVNETQFILCIAAYKAIIHYLKKNGFDIFLSYYIDKKHILLGENRDILAMVYISEGCDLNASTIKYDDNSGAIVTHLTDTITKYHTNYIYKKYINFFIDQSGFNVLPKDENTNIILLCRSFRLLNSKTRKECYNYDIVENMKEPNEELLCERFAFLNENAPDYWFMVGKPIYQPIIQKLVKDSFKYIKWFPELYDSKYQSLNEKSCELLNNKNRDYILGFPIHIGNMSNDCIVEQILKIQDVGVDQFCDDLIIQNRKLIGEIYKGVKISNIEDNCVNDVYSLSPSDVIHYIENGFLYTFSRPDFIHIRKTKKNPYTNLELPSNIILQINVRLKFFENKNINYFQTIREMLWSVYGSKNTPDNTSSKADDQHVLENISNFMNDEYFNIWYPAQSLGLLPAIISQFNDEEMEDIE